MKARKSLLVLGMALAVISLTSLPAPAAVAVSCTINTTSVSFGNYNVFSGLPLDSTGSVIYNCNRRAAITITLDRGGAPSFNPRRMLKVGEALNYNLYLDAARTTIWGDGTGGTQVYSDPRTPRNRNVAVTIYGRIPAGQDVTAGSYANSVTATINF